ncbi:unnamed protein product [Sordaria macrospora k-hell]|uniref:WGS project CABT00000000 data, contig 2.1 n=1 Tax=Sordaria macrospora (strain ATCC MYA-333 / DSM 997 / K(L3346) / K-hell) TaxID=771870 RepID=F7VL55_SORMK|nr:uncharacterized protein SMAC_00448 [Sordaria macrospora k-hell]CCC06232.1 unnamed protein product [Sordaria macrospora k-hell]
MDEMDYTMQASAHPVPLPGWWVNSAQEHPSTINNSRAFLTRHHYYRQRQHYTTHSSFSQVIPTTLSRFNIIKVIIFSLRFRSSSFQHHMGLRLHHFPVIPQTLLRLRPTRRIEVTIPGNQQEGHPAPGHVHQYRGNGINNNNANNGNVTTPTTGVSTTNVSAGYTVGPNWMLGFTDAPPAFQGPPGPSHFHMTPGTSFAPSYGMNGSSSGNMMSRQGARPAANPVSNSSPGVDADTVMGNTEAQGGLGASGGSSAQPTAAGAAPQVGGSGSGPIQSGAWTSQGQNRSAPPFSFQPLQPGLEGFPIPGFSTGLHPRHTDSLRNNSASAPSPVLSDPEHWRPRHTHAPPAFVTLSYYQHHLHPNGLPPGHRRQSSHQSTQPSPTASTASSTGSHIRLPAPDPRSRLPPYRPSGMSNPTENGNDFSHALQPPLGPQASSSGAHRPSRQPSGSGFTNTAAPLPDNQSLPGAAIASASTPTSASTSNTGPPIGQSTSFSRGPAYPELQTEMRDYLARAHDHSDSFSDDDLDLPDPMPARRPISEEEAARLEERAAEFQERAAQMIRARQMARGQSSKKVASKKAIDSLEPVNVADLPESDGSKLPYRPSVAEITESNFSLPACDICYNDYGTMSPEGITEQPLRIPMCKHPASDSDNPYRSANTNQTSSMPHEPPVASYTSVPAPPSMNSGEWSFGFGPSNRDHAFPYQVPDTRGPAQGQPPVVEQHDQPPAPPYPGDNTFPGSSTFGPPGSGRQQPQ